VSDKSKRLFQTILTNVQQAAASVDRAQFSRTALLWSQTTPQDEKNTATNTRPNSMRNSILETDDESRYFATAAKHFNTFDRGKHTIMPRRRPSIYFPDSDVEVMDSEIVIPETSQLPLHPKYNNTTDLHILKRSAEAVWSSQQGLSMPPAYQQPKDLKSLTRTVSNQNGTLSQAVMRRPSLPFQSPTKKG
jgi:hypothetical protein